MSGLLENLETLTKTPLKSLFLGPLSGPLMMVEVLREHSLSSDKFLYTKAQVPLLFLVQFVSNK